MKCPNIDSKEYKELEKKVGKVEAYRLWIKTNNFSFNVEEDDKPNIAITKLKIKYIANVAGFFSPQSHSKLENEVNKYNKGRRIISLMQSSTGSLYLRLNKANIGSNSLETITVPRSEINTSEKIDNPSKINSSISKLGFSTSFKEDYSRVNFILGKISNSDSIPESQKYLANWFRKLPNEYKQVKINLIQSNPKYNGKYFDSTIELSNALTENDLARVFLHELIHHFVNGSIFDPNSNQKQIVDNLKGLYKTAKNKWEEKIGQSINVDFIRANPDFKKAYGLTSFEEFIPELFTNKDFQTILSDSRIGFTENQNFLDRFVEIIKDLIESVNKLLFNKGVDSKFVTLALSESVKLVNSITASNIDNLVPTEEYYSINENESKIYTFINKLQNRLNKVEQDLRKEKNLSRKKELEERESILKEQIKKIEELKDLNHIVEIAEEQLNYVSSMLGKQNLTEADIIEIQNFNSLYSNISGTVLTDKEREDIEIVDNEGNVVIGKNEVYNRLLDIEKQAKLNSEKIFKVSSNYIKDLYFKLYGKDATIEELYKVNDDIGILSANTLSTGRQGVKLLNIKESLNKLAVNKANVTREELSKENNELFAKVKENTLFKEKGFNLFKQFDKEGKWNGNKINKFNPEYWKDLVKYSGKLNKALSKSKSPKDIEDYFKWFNENHIVVDYKRLEDEKYNKALKDKFGDKYATELLNQAKTKLDAYTVAESEYIEWLNDNENREDIKEQRLFNWRVSNSPFKAYEFHKGKSEPKLSTGNYPKRFNKEFVTASPISQHFDKNYQSLEESGNEVLLDYLDFMDKTINRLANNLPERLLASKGLSRNFLPIVAKGLIERYSKEGLLNGFKGAFGEWATDLITENEKSQIKSIDEVTGKEDFQLYIAGLNPITKWDENLKENVIDRDSQSDDIFKILELTISNLAMYEHRSAIEDTYKLVSRAFENVGIDDFGININKNELKNIKTLNEFSDKVFYSKHNDLSKNTEFKIGDKHVNLDKAGRNLLKWVQLKAMAFNIFSAANEFIFGIASNWVYSTGSEVYSQKEWAKGLGITLSYLSGNRDKHKLRNILDIYGVREHTSLEQGDISNKISKKLYWMQTGSETSTRSITLIASMLATKIQTEKGKISLWEAYNENGELDSTKLSKEEIEDWSPSSNKGTDSVNSQTRFRNKIDKLINKLHGNYSTATPIMLKSNFWGLAISQFRSWIYEGTAARFEKEHYDEDLDLVIKGRYTTMTTAKAWKALGNHLLFKKDAFDDISAPDEANIKKNVAEVSLAIGLYMFMLFVKALRDDDEDKNSTGFYTANALMNVGFRIQSDLFFYINPEEVEKLNSKFIPATVLINDIYDFGEATKKTLMGEATIEKGMYAGHNRALKEIAQFLPISNQIYKDIALISQTVDKIKR